MRGKAVAVGVILSSPGITPAHAGKSINCVCHCITSKDHPRPCGEKIPNGVGVRIGQGSPPPMRGKVVLRHGRRAPERITPAHAGKSRRARTLRQACKDHPRPCGEKSMPSSAMRAMQGSPPPMRGKASWATTARWAAGITPAHAGKSLCVGQ